MVYGNPVSLPRNKCLPQLKGNQLDQGGTTAPRCKGGRASCGVGGKCVPINTGKAVNCVQRLACHQGRGGGGG